MSTPFSREIVTTWVEGDAYDVHIKGQHVLRMDQPVKAGGTDTGPNPTDVWVAVLGACVAYYGGKFLRHHELSPELEVTTTYKMGIGSARVTKIEISVDAPGITEEHAAEFQKTIEGGTIHNSLETPPNVRITKTDRGQVP